MKIEVKNFGKIKKGQIDLDKRVTVFVGYNNSGKTYMSQLLWILNSIKYEIEFDSGGNLSESLVNENKVLITVDMLTQFLNEYNESIKNVLLPDLFNVDNTYFSKDNFSIVFSDYLLNELKKSTINCFATIGKDQSNIKSYYAFKKDADSDTISIHKVDMDKPIGIFDILSTEQSTVQQNTNIRAFSSFIQINESNSFSEIFSKSVSKIIFNLIFQKRYISHFLPANRLFYPSFYKYIYSVAKEEKDLIDERLKKGGSLKSIQSLSSRPYTEPMDDLIQKMYKLNNNTEEKSDYNDLLNELKVLIGGDIIIKSSEGIAPIEFYLKLDNGKELEMYMSSSSANQLTTLYLYLKYWANATNNFLIIDEPEENLHPENQIKLVNILMKFADRGNNKILITTHSPLITDHINNYANLSYLNEAGENTEQIIADDNFSMTTLKNIKQSDYGVYFFNGDSIKEYAIDDYGAYFKDFQVAEDKVKNMSNILKDHIYNNIHNDGKE